MWKRCVQELSQHAKDLELIKKKKLFKLRDGKKFEDKNIMAH